MTLRDTILMALENNRDIEIERLNVQLTGLDLRASQGFYDPTLTGSFSMTERMYQSPTRLPAGRMAGC
jgi:outer membrane protein TolC